MVAVLDRVSRVALDLLFPPKCELCGRGGSMLCDRCTALLPPAEGSRCARCWTPLESGDVCLHCIESPPSFTSIRASFVMDDGARSLVHQLKYEGMTALAEPMAALMVANLDVDDADLVVPVPLHWRRERSRGYNQSRELARHLGMALRLPVEAKAARRTRATAPLARTMHRDERRTIVAGAFAGRAELVGGHKILLVDDVVTTGATLDECSRALLVAGAASVRCATWARAD